MRLAVLLLSTVVVALAASCGQTQSSRTLSFPAPRSSVEPSPSPTRGPGKSSGEQRTGCPTNSAHLIAEDQSSPKDGSLLQARHCVYEDLNPKNYKVKAGVFDEAKSDEEAEQVVNVKAIHLHPKYNASQTSYDIALIELDTPLTFGDHVQPVCLPSSDDAEIVFPNMLWVTGWGDIEQMGPSSRQLRQADVPIVDLPTCEKEYPKKINEDVEFCAGKEGVDSCQGDSGGPVVQQAPSGAWFQYGIVSWGKGCAHKWHAGVYSRVSAYCDFINTTTNGVVQCQTPA